MIVQSIHFTFSMTDADEMQSILVELRDASRKEAGVVSFDVGRSKEKPDVFALWEVYRDAEGLKAHTETEHYARLVVGRIRPRAIDHAVEKVELL